MADLKFLVVDDSPTIRKMTLEILKSLGYSKVVEAENGQDALMRLNLEGADVIITDWNMPEMDGMEFVKAIRSDPTNKDVRILMVTTRDSSDDRIAACLTDVDDYLVKPFTADDIKEKLSRIM